MKTKEQIEDRIKYYENLKDKSFNVYMKAHYESDIKALQWVLED